MKNLALLRWPVTLFLPVILYFCAPVDVSPKFPLFVGITAMAVLAWAFNVFPAIGVAALLSFAYLLGKVAPANVVFGPWTTVLPWLSFAAVIIGDGQDRAGPAPGPALPENYRREFFWAAVGLFPRRHRAWHCSSVHSRAHGHLVHHRFRHYRRAED